MTQESKVETTSEDACEARKRLSQAAAKARVLSSKIVRCPACQKLYLDIDDSPHAAEDPNRDLIEQPRVQ